jgi:hypothetical protein
MFVIEISNDVSRLSALKILEDYGITFEITKYNMQLRYVVHTAHNHESKYGLCEAAFQMNWYQQAGFICDICTMYGAKEKVCGHIQFRYPIE